MITKEKILGIAKQKGKIATSDLSKRFLVSRQYLNRLLKGLVATGELIKLGSTRYSFYVLPQYAKDHKEIFPLQYKKTLKNKSLEEHKVLDDIEKTFPRFNNIPENIRSIFTYAFTEMLNNAIEHSTSDRIRVEVSIQNKILSFIVNDFGIGVFRNIMMKINLESEFEAIQDLMKGKTTTMPKSHSGEGIFFTSKVGDLFILNSFGYELIINNEIPDVFVKKIRNFKHGTKVKFSINISATRHLNELFKQYTDQTKDSDYGFDKTEIQVKLYTLGGVYISRSQARRVLAGLEKFKIILFDFDNVPLVGQAFADEIFRVFHTKYPNIKLETSNMDEGVQFMVERAISEAKTER